MKNKLKSVIQPFVDKINLVKKHDEKLHALAELSNELKVIDPLDMTLQQFTEWQQIQHFINYLENKKEPIGAIQIGNNSLFQKIGDILCEEMEQDEELISLAERFNKAVLKNNQSAIDDIETKYLEVFRQVYKRVSNEAEALINEYLTALSYVRNSNYKIELENHLPKPLTETFIRWWDEYEREKRKFNPKAQKNIIPIIHKR